MNQLLGDARDILLSLATACIGVYGLAVGVVGFLNRQLPAVLRCCAVLGSLLLIHVGYNTDIIGLILVGIAFIYGIKKPSQPKNSLQEAGKAVS